MQAVKKEDITPAIKYYFDAIMGPFKPDKNEAPEPPDECPVCGAPQEMFDPIF